MAFKPPFVWRPVDGRIVVKMPFDPADPRSNGRWLRTYLGSRIRPEYVQGTGQWEIARGHLRHVVRGLADRFGWVNVYLDYLENQRCDTRCQEAVGDDCVCQCAGENHGGADYQRDWRQIGETTLIAPDPATRQRHVVVYPEGRGHR